MIALFLTIDQIGNLSYTYKEIIQKELPEFWNASREGGRILSVWQDMVVELLPVFKEHLPNSFEELADKESQTILINYLKLRSIYALAEKFWEQINTLCHNLAVEKSRFNMEKVESIKRQLVDVFEKIDSIPILEIAEDQDNGFDKLHQKIGKIDFVVFQKYWWYSDICGIVYSKGVQDEKLWNDVFPSHDPITSDITGLMDNPDDNKTIRMY